MEGASFFHIMVQGINKEYIFNTAKEKNKYLDLILKNKEEIQMIAYCVMGNHAHFLVKTDDIKKLQIWMAKSNTSYAIYYNKSHNRVGYVFKGRYKIQPIKNDKHFYCCVEYIHLNPVKANICREKTEYKFSSYQKEYNGDEQKINQKITYLLNNFMEQSYNEKEEFDFLEEDDYDKKKICEQTIQKFLKDKNINKDELKEKKDYLTELVKILRDRNGISYRIMAEYIGIGRETLRKYKYKK